MTPEEARQAVRDAAPILVRGVAAGVATGFLDGPFLILSVGTTQGPPIPIEDCDRAPEPRIVEPAVWGVVYAACVHDPIRRDWVRHPDGLWWPVLPHGAEEPHRYDAPDDWDSLLSPALLRPGVGDVLHDEVVTS